MVQHIRSATARQTATPGTRHNVLYIGVGGTGVKTLKHIRALHAASQANDTVVGDSSSGVEPHYFVIDTDAAELARARFDRTSEHRLEIGTAQTWYGNVSRQNGKEADQLRAWLPERIAVRDGAVVPNGLVNLVNNNGAGQRRLVSRMVFYHNLGHTEKPLRGKLEQAIIGLNSIDDAAQDAQTLTIEVVFGVAGGTGSGCATYVGHVIREIVDNIATGVRPTVRAHAFLDTAMAASRYGTNAVRVQANVYAALMELEHFQKAGLKQVEVTQYLESGSDEWSLNDETGRRRFAAHSGATYDGVLTAPFDTIRLFELTLSQGARDTYAAAAECLYTMGIPAMQSLIASHESNLQLQMVVNAVGDKGTDQQGAGLAAHYGAAGAAVLYLPRHRLSEYLVYRISADALGWALPQNLNFADFSSDMASHARLKSLDRMRETSEEVGRDSDAETRQKMDGVPFVQSIIELARGESRRFSDHGHSGSDAIGLWGKILRSVSRRKSGATMANTFLKALEESIQDPIRLAEHRVKGRLVAKKDAVGAAEGARRTDVQQIDERIEIQAKKLERRLNSDDFWQQVTDADSDIEEISESAGISPSAIAELSLLYVLVGAGDDADIYHDLVRTTATVRLPWLEWAPDSDTKPLDWFGTLKPSDMPNPLNRQLRMRLADGAKKASRTMETAISNAAERSKDADNIIRELSRPRRGLEKLTGLFSGDSDEAAISNEVDKLDRDLKEMTNDALLQYARVRATHRIVEVAFQAVLDRLLAYSRLQVELDDTITEFKSKASDLLGEVGGSGFTHDHEVLTDARGAVRYWDWYYEDQVLGGRNALLMGDAVEAPGSRRCGTLKLLNSNIMTLLRRSVSYCTTKIASSDEAGSLLTTIAPDVDKLVTEHLRDVLTLERAILLQVDYGRVEEIEDRALSHELHPAHVLAQFYEDIDEGRYTRAAWGDDDDVSDLLKNVVDAVVNRAGPMANIMGHEGSPAPNADQKTYALLGAIDPNLDEKTSQSFALERSRFYQVLAKASGLSLSAGANEAANVSPDRLFVVKQKLVVTLDAFPTVRRHAHAMLSELSSGLAQDDLFTSKYFVEVCTSEDGQEARRIPTLPMLSFDQQRAAALVEQRMVDEERQALALALLLLSDDAEFVHDGEPGIVQFEFRQGHWTVIIHWDRDELGSQILQIEEPRLLESARDFRVIVREATSGDANFYRDPKLELVDQATRDVMLLIDICESLEDKLAALMGRRDQTSLGFAQTESLKSELRQALGESMSQRHETIPGSNPPKRFAAHHAADVVRMEELVSPLLREAPSRRTSGTQASSE